ncbi:mucin-5AC isoform X1 [Bacillus rossius redtenbacheri]|uniref:mucin-5AC isoform X1 n=1 Tax=Bacillus rossius redtenbacheri TaxID=93214 RepID=UPI002FDE13B4
MPFVLRAVEPVHLSRKSLHREDGSPLVNDGELDAVANNTLCGVLRQLASLVVVAGDIFEDLSAQLRHVGERSRRLRARISQVEEKVAAFDPKKVAVPESDICTFSQRARHYSSALPPAAGLFGAETRPQAVRRLYEAAARTPVPALRQLDRRASRLFVCTPVLGASRRAHQRHLDIETRKPAALDELRRWTSQEAVGDVTVGPDCSARIAPPPEAGPDELDHRLPSPEEQVKTVALRFPSEVVLVDTSGRAFDRMSLLRRSWLHDGAEVRRRDGRARRPRSRRRNTIAGTDQRELAEAAGDATEGEEGPGAPRPLESLPAARSASSDLLRPLDDPKKSHFNSLKLWGKGKLRLIRSASVDKGAPLEDANIYEAVGAKRRALKASQLPLSTSSGPVGMAVKLRENSLLRRKKKECGDDAVHSSSGNWSASSESGRASVGSSEAATVTSVHPKSTTTTLSSAGTSSNSSAGSRRKFATTSASSSFSEGTLTPDIAPCLPDDGETSSVYSCDTEGYYTSFHVDSGLKTLREEDPGGAPQALHSTSALSGSPNRSAESEYELFGKGSTSTTTSSAGTVCTTLMFGPEGGLPAPAVPERKSSLEAGGSLERNMQKVTVLIHAHKDEGATSESPDSGHNTSSSPVGSTSSPQGTLTARSSEYEFSESDLEGFDRMERIRVKTAINSSRIPSMCVITPPQSDDEAGLGQYGPLYRLPQSASEPESRHHHRRFEKQLSTDSDRSSENEFTKVSPRSPPKRNSWSRLDRMSGSGYFRTDDTFPSRSPSGETVIFNGAVETPSPSAEPPGAMLDRAKGVGRKQSASSEDAGDYVTIMDVHGNRTQARHLPPGHAPYYSNMAKTKPPPAAAAQSPTRDEEYVSLNELPSSAATQNTAASSADSLERKRRLGARVTLDSEGKVVYSSDSLKRNKGGYSSFEPGPYVKDTIASPVASPMTAHRVPKANIRPVTLSSPATRYPTSPQLGKVIIRAGGKTASPTPVVAPPPGGRPLSPRQNSRGAYVNVQSPDDPHRAHCVTSSRSSPSTSPAEEEEGKIPPCPSNPRLTSYLQRTNPALFGRISDAVPSSKIKRSDSYRLANSPLLQARKMSNIELAANVNVNRFDGDACKTLKSNNKVDTLGGGKSERRGPAGLGNGSCPAGPPKCAAEEGTRVVDNPNARGRKFYGPQIRVAPSLLGSPAGKTSPVVSRDTERARVLAHSGTIPSYAAQHGHLLYEGQRRAATEWTHAAQGGQHRSLPALQVQGSQTLPSRRSPLKARAEAPYAQPHGDMRYNTIATAGDRERRTQAPPGRPWQESRSTAYYSSHFPQPDPCPASARPPQKHVTFVPSSGRRAPCLNPVSIPEVPRSNPGVRSGSNASGYPSAGGLNPYQLQERFYSSTPEKKSVVRYIQQNASTNNFSDTLSPIERIPGREDKKLPQTSDKNFFSRISNKSNVESDKSPRKPSSQTKSSMTAEELFAAIHRSKKKLNIRSEPGGRSSSPSCSSAASLSPGTSEASLNGDQAARRDLGANRSRHSWSPDCDEGPEQRALSPVTTPGSRQSRPGLQTSRNDFKRLLLQHGGGSRGRLSAVEQLKLSGVRRDEGPKSAAPRSPADKRGSSPKLLQSPRSLAGWRFASPRTDVLSSTILEDCAGEENTSGSPRENASKSSSGSDKGRGSGTARRLLDFSPGAERDTVASQPVLEQYTREPSVRRSPPWAKGPDPGARQSKGRGLSPEPLSPSNVKENVDVNQQRLSPGALALAKRAYGSPDPLYRPTDRLSASSPRVSSLLAKQRFLQNCPPASTRSALTALSPKTTLETAL